MSEVKVYRLKIEFPLAFFKIPYTVKTRKTYLIPRKRAILSLFNAFFEEPISFWKVGRSRRRSRSQGEEILSRFLVGAELISFEKTIEIQRIIQIKGSSVERPPSETELVVNAQYELYLIPKEEITLKKYPVNYYPYGGQNDYLASCWELDTLKGKIEKVDNTIFENYQLIDRNKLKFAEEIIVENALEKYVVAKGRVKFSQPVDILKVCDRDILIF